MTPIEIAYFKHFIFDKSLAGIFLRFYRTRRIQGSERGDNDANPESIEEYLLKTSVKDVIMKAFYFTPTNENAQLVVQTYDYWKDIDNKWQEYMGQNYSNFSNESWPALRKTFAILRQNWDLQEFWRKENLESTEEVYKRMHIELPLPEFRWAHGFVPPERVRPDAEQIATNIFNAKDGDILVRVHRNDDSLITSRVIFIFRELKPGVDGVQYRVTTYCTLNIRNRQLRISNGERNSFAVNAGDKDISFRLAFDEEKRILLDKLENNGLKWDDSTKEIIPLPEKEEVDAPLIDFIDEEDDPLKDFDFLDDVLPSTYRLKSNEISINFNKGYKLTFNKLCTNEIKNLGFKFARLAKNKAGELCLIFNRQKGANVTNTGSVRGNINVAVNSADICKKIKLFFSLKSDYSILKVEKLQATQEFIIYKITKEQ